MGVESYPLTYEFADKLASAIIKLKLKSASKPQAELFTMLADIRDYFLWWTIKCPKEKALESIMILEKLETYFTGVDEFHAGFFFTLSQLLTLKHQETYLEPEKEALSEDKWQESFQKTLRRLNID